MTRIKVTIITVMVMQLLGCAAMLKPRNLSTGEEVALIEAVGGFSNKCGVGTSLRIRTPTPNARSIIVDAGPVKIFVLCVGSGPFGDGHQTSRFNFVAVSGHTYAIRKATSACFELLDATVGAIVVACEPLFHDYKDLSSGNETALVRPGAASSDKGGCRHRVDRSWMSTRDLLEIDAGPTTIDVTCATGHRNPRYRTLSFDFVAESGHTYTFTDTDEECIRLLDITSEEVAITCKPYGKVE